MEFMISSNTHITVTKTNKMTTNLFKIGEGSKGQFSVYRDEPDYITVKKKSKEDEYTVELLIFKKEDLEELQSIQMELYDNPDDKQVVMERILKFLKKFSNK